jgi:hypothetical protein
MIRTVVLAPVPCRHLRSAQAVPSLAERVAFASSQSAVPNLPVGVPVFIYPTDTSDATTDDRRLLTPGRASWTGTLGAIVDAVERGRRSGKHPDAGVRPPTAEATDTPVQFFWEVHGLQRTAPGRPLSDFASAVPIGNAPRWPVLAELDC